MTHLPDAPVSSRRVREPSRDAWVLVFTTLYTGESLGERLKSTSEGEGKCQFMEHPPAKACARCLHTITLVNFLLSHSTIMGRRGKNSHRLITVLRYILTGFSEPSSAFMSHLWVSGPRWEKSTRNLVVKTHQRQPQTWENWLTQIQMCWRGMNSRGLLKKVNFWI